MSDIPHDHYRDTAQRLHHDPEFRAAVDMLWAMATRHGFTPGELKQIAFAAAIKCEEYATRSMLVRFLPHRLQYEVGPLPQSNRADERKSSPGKGA